MAKVIAITNQKGGVGKTTTAVNIAASLAAAEKRTLLIDFDPQGNASAAFSLNEQRINENNIYHVLSGDEEIENSLLTTSLKYLHVAASNQDLAGAEVELVTAISRETKLKVAIERIRNRYEYIIIDCPPSLGLLTLNALAAADSFIVPLQCEYYALEGLSSLMQTVSLIKSSINPNLECDGIVLTMYDARNKLSRQVEEDVKEHFGELVFKTLIPRNVRLSEAPSHGKPIILYDITSKGNEAYLLLTKELIEKTESSGVEIPLFSRVPFTGIQDSAIRIQDKKDSAKNNENGIQWVSETNSSEVLVKNPSVEVGLK